MMATLALTLLSGVLYAASFPPLSLAPLAWVALAPFFAAVTLVSPRRAAVLGCVWAVTAAYGVAWWLPSMVSGYFQASRLVGWSIFLVIAVGLAGWYFAAFAAWLSALARWGVAGPLTAAVGWGACEFARARLLIGNPWALAGYSQVPHASLTQIADATGPYGVGMLLAGVDAAPAAARGARAARAEAAALRARARRGAGCDAGIRALAARAGVRHGAAAPRRAGAGGRPGEVPLAARLPGRERRALLDAHRPGGGGGASA